MFCYCNNYRYIVLFFRNGAGLVLREFMHESAIHGAKREFMLFAKLCGFLTPTVGRNRSGWMKSKEGAHVRCLMYKNVHDTERTQS